MVEVTTVPTASAMPTGSMSSTRATLHGDTRRGQVHSAGAAVLGSDETELPLLVAVGRRARHPGRLGSPGRLGRQLAPPGQELRVGEGRAVGHLLRHRAGRSPGPQRRTACAGPRRRRHRPGAGATTAVPAGAAPASDSRVAARTSRGCATPLWPTLLVRSSATTPSPRPSFAGQSRHGAAVHAGDHEPAHVARGSSPADLSARSRASRPSAR